MQPKQIPSSWIDRFIEAQWKFETPAYQAILKERLDDLCRRNITQGEAIPYLKSAGWSIDFAVVYGNFLKFVEDNNTKKDETKMSNNDNSIPVPQVQQLLRELVMQMAEAAGFRDIAEGEEIKDYRYSLMEFLQSMNVKDDTVAKDQTVEMLSELSVRLDQSRELTKTLLLYYKDKQ